MVCPVVEQGLPYIWIANYGWCTEGLNRWATRRKWLVVDADQADREAFTARYGQSDRQIVVQNHELLLYSWSMERYADLRGIICGSVQSFKRTPPC